MFRSPTACSVVTAVLPNAAAAAVIEDTVGARGASALAWKARGTMLRDHWMSRWMPPISPVKTVLQMVVPQPQVDAVVSSAITSGRLHQQAVGAVFSTPCDHAYMGSAFHGWPNDGGRGETMQAASESLSIIHCSVGQALSDRVARAAVDAGAHGPIIYFTEGRGLRDRIGWLRITKEQLQEIQMVVVDQSLADDVFDAMADAGGFSRPGRGLMYRMDVDRGMFNLPRNFTKHRHDADMQQVIRAIDHLSGHSHWRDQSVYQIGDQGRVAGVADFKGVGTTEIDRVALTVIAPREHLERVTDLIIDSGATGLSIVFGRFVGETPGDTSSVRIHDEHCVVRSIIPPEVAARACAVVDDTAEQFGVQDLCVLVNSIQRTATYVPGNTEYRKPPKRVA